VTAIRHAAEGIPRRGEFESAVLDSMTEMVLACNADGKVTIVNRAMAAALGLEPPAITLARWEDLCSLHHPDGTPIAAEDDPIRRALRGELVRDMEVIIAPASQAGRRTVVANGANLRDAKGRVIGAVVIARDVTEQRQSEAAVSDAALHDPVTGLASLTLFVERILRVQDSARRKRWSTAILTVDIDKFRSINDRFGHAVGDEVLAAVARRLEKALYANDSLWHIENAARIGGDQFFLICEGIASEAAASAIAERINESLRDPMIVGEEIILVTAGIGIAIDGKSDRAPDALIVEAEAAMRWAKETGRGHHAVFAEDMRSRSATLIERETELRRALDNGEFRLVYQPKILVSTGLIVGVEALLRWEHPERGTTAPLDFIPLAEDTGLIVPIGAWVLQEACAQAQRWHAAAPDRIPMIVSVNVSSRQLDGSLAKTVAAVIASTGIDPTTLCLEITESAAMENAEFAITVLRALSALGVRISIDDFGTGYSSLAYLRRFPLDEIKIDQSFVDGLGRDPEATAIVAAVMGMAHALNLTVVAEGVETEAQDTALRNLGCDETQGYLYSRALTAEALQPFLDQQRMTRLPGSGGLASPTVVVIDDAAEIRHLARVSLTAVGFAVREAERGDDGLELCRRLAPDCVLLDVHLPGADGLDVCRALRADPVTRDTTIVMLTVDSLASAKIEAFARDADDYIVKPFAPRDLVGRVTAAIGRRRAATESRLQEAP
jgi:diguanylate cyclase (GGDEF)-like protein/PAS domain S-box-containing protein